MLIVGDGKALTMIDYEVDQVSRWPIVASPLSVLLNPNKDLTGVDKVTRNDGPVLLAQAGEPKKPECGDNTIAFDKVQRAPAGFSLAWWTTHSEKGWGGE